MTDPNREERGPKTPSVSLVGAIDLLIQVQSGIGFATASAATIVNTLGHETLSGSSKRKLAALNHYGLLERVGQSSYKVSDLGRTILHPTDDRERREALAEAARRPRLYQELWRRYEGQAVPSVLRNILIREYGVLPQSAESVAKSFVESAEYAELLRNGVLLSAPARQDGAQDEPQRSTAPGAMAPSSTSVAASQVSASDWVSRGSSSEHLGQQGALTQRYTIALDTKGRVATVELPVPVRPRDLTTLGNWVNFMRAVAEDEEPDTSSS